MVAIRNGTSHKPKSQSSPLWIVYFPQLVALFLVASISFYGGVLLGMQMNSNGAHTSTTTQEDETKYLRIQKDNEDFNARVQAEVDRRLALVSSTNNNANNNFSNNNNNDKKKKDNKDDGRPRRFPTTISKFASGASLISKNDFLATFDYGIPKPPSKREHESDPGKDDVLLLFGSTKAMPDDNLGVVYTDENGNDIPHLSAQDATKNCGGLNVIFTESHGDVEQCTAIVGNYESYHIQRWLRINPNSFSKLDKALSLTPVGRGLQTNGMDKFSAPSDNFALQNQALLETYFSRLEDTLASLKPMANACAGNDNTVIVMVCNTGQSDLLINFVCSAIARGFGDIVKEKVLLFATDEGVLDIGRGLGLRTFYDEKVSPLSI